MKSFFILLIYLIHKKLYSILLNYCEVVAKHILVYVFGWSCLLFSPETIAFYLINICEYIKELYPKIIAT